MQLGARLILFNKGKVKLIYVSDNVYYVNLYSLVS